MGSDVLIIKQENIAHKKNEKEKKSSFQDYPNVLKNVHMVNVMKMGCNHCHLKLYNIVPFSTSIIGAE